MQLSPLLQTLVLHFGEMGSRWGISRTVGQIYAFLVFSEEPQNADQIGTALGFSRSNVGIGIKELQSWNLVRLQHFPGDRKDYFSVPEDPWEIARTLVTERRQREVDPTLTVLRQVMVDEASSEQAYAVKRVAEMHDLIELLVSWSEEMQRLSASDLQRLMKLGAGVSKVLEFSRKGVKRKTS